MAPIYVYGIIPTGDRIIFDVGGIDGHDDDVCTIPHSDIAAVVSASPLADWRGLKRDEAGRYLVRHQRVVEVVMQDFPILPVKFGTVLPEATWVYRLLAQGEKLFQVALETFADREQMEVVILWDAEEVFKEIGREEPIVQLKARVLGLPAEQTMAERIAIGQMVQAFLERRRAALRERILPPLQEVALDVVVNPPMDDSMVANVGLLVDGAGNGALDKQLEMLDEAFEGQLTFRCVGPLPPYSFATVEVQVPSFEAVDEARRRLGLGETATVAEIKRAYRRLADRLHPDHNPEDPEAAARMAHLTQAYGLLMTYAESVQGSRGAGGQGSRGAGGQGSKGAEERPSGIRFSREAVEGTLLIAVRRQEVSIQGTTQV